MSYTEADWRAGLDGELAFWRKWPRQHPAAVAAKLDLMRPFHGTLRAVVCACGPGPVSVLEVGAGMVSAMGLPQYDDPPCEITRTDPLGVELHLIAAAQGIELPYVIYPVAAENVAETFGPGAFDVAFGQNCLDHGFDPVHAFEQIAAVLKPNGRLVTRHIYRCGSRNRFRGLHRWDFSIARGSFLIEGVGCRGHVGDRPPLELEAFYLELDPLAAAEVWLVAVFVKRG